MDNLKKYLQEHTNEMDIDAPSAKLLQRIQLHTAQKKDRKIIKMVMRYAAAACIVLVAAMGIKYFFYSNKNLPQDDVAKKITPAKVLPGTMNIDTENKVDLAIVKPLQTAVQRSQKKRAAEKIDAYELLHSFENNYTQLVNLQLGSIRKTPVYGETQGFSEFKTSLKQMDADEAALRIQIKTKGLNATSLEQLIAIYQEKLNVLKSLQAEIHKMNKRIEQNQLSTDTLAAHFINI